MCDKPLAGTCNSAIVVDAASGVPGTVIFVSDGDGEILGEATGVREAAAATADAIEPMASTGGGKSHSAEADRLVLEADGDISLPVEELLPIMSASFFLRLAISLASFCCCLRSFSSCRLRSFSSFFFSFSSFFWSLLVIAVVLATWSSKLDDDLPFLRSCYQQDEQHERTDNNKQLVSW
jgi:hypothetical protein